MSKLKILNLYAGIGGNRKLWGDDHDITAVEINPDIAKIYQDLYPNDTVIVGDAHEYLRQHFRDFVFIWASPPCISHSKLNFYNWHIPERLRYPDMNLYQEIIFLQKFFKGKWVIENVKPYYEPLIPPTFKSDRHYFWSSDFILVPETVRTFTNVKDKNKKMEKIFGFDLSSYKIKSNLKRKILRNCVKPEIGKYIFEQIMKG
jgi:DNA (cytosine-5)-methyltransferase 1